MNSNPQSSKGLSTLHTSLKILSLIVLALITVTIVYVSIIAIKNWSFIGV